MALHNDTDPCPPHLSFPLALSTGYFLQQFPFWIVSLDKELIPSPFKRNQREGTASIFLKRLPSTERLPAQIKTAPGSPQSSRHGSLVSLRASRLSKMRKIMRSTKRKKYEQRRCGFYMLWQSLPQREVKAKTLSTWSNCILDTYLTPVVWKQKPQSWMF